MTHLDWIVVAVLCAISMAVGLVLTRRAGKEGASGYFTGNRSLPWWAIGLSNTARLSLTLNDTLAGGILNPYDENSPYYDPASNVPGLAPMRRVKLLRQNTELFNGIVESYDYQYNLDRQNIVAVNCVDDFWLLANTFMDELNVTAQTSGQRINTVLALPEVDYTGTTSIATGTVNLGHDAAYTVPDGTNVLAYLQQINNTAEFGRHLCRRTGF